MLLRGTPSTSLAFGMFFIGYHLRRKFGIHPELGPSLAQLQKLPVEKLEGLTEAIFDWVEISDFTEWLRQQLANK